MKTPGRFHPQDLIRRARFFLARLLVGTEYVRSPYDQLPVARSDVDHTQIASPHTEERYEMLTRMLSDYVLSHSVAPNGTLGVEWVIGESFEALTGYKPDEVSYWDSVHPDDKPVILRAIEQTLTNQKVTSESRLKTRNGNYIWISTARQPIWDEAEGRVSRYYSVIKDITQRKRMEEALRESEARQRDLLNAIPDIMFRNHRDGTYLDYHTSHPELLLVSPEDFLGKKINDVLPSDLAAEFMSHFDQVMASGHEAVFEYMLPIQDQEQWFEARILRTGQDELLTIVRDITERKLMQVQQFELALERERMRLLTDFIQGAAHEFRTPLSVINSSAYLMAHQDDLTERMQKVRHIEGYVKRITDLVDTMLTITRLETSNALTNEPVDIGSMLRMACQNTRQKFGTRPELRCEWVDDLPHVMGDPIYLAAALRHILDNAYQFTPPDGIITAASGAEDGHIWIRVSNTGPGIPPDVLPNVFKTFWREDIMRTTPGFGLGLPITRRIVELHGGTITISSEPGQETHVCVTVPATPAPQPDSEPV